MRRIIEALDNNDDLVYELRSRLRWDRSKAHRVRKHPGRITVDEANRVVETVNNLRAEEKPGATQVTLDELFGERAQQENP